MIHSVEIEGVEYKLFDVGYVDDTALTVSAHAKDLVKKVARVAECAFATFLQFGMLLNLLAGKSECLPMWRGPYSNKARINLEDVGNICKCYVRQHEFILRFVD